MAHRKVETIHHRNVIYRYIWFHSCHWDSMQGSSTESPVQGPPSQFSLVLFGHILTSYLHLAALVSQCNAYRRGCGLRRWYGCKAFESTQTAHPVRLNCVWRHFILHQRTQQSTNNGRFLKTMAWKKRKLSELNTKVQVLYVKKWTHIVNRNQIQGFTKTWVIEKSLRSITCYKIHVPGRVEVVVLSGSIHVSTALVVITVIVVVVAAVVVVH